MKRQTLLMGRHHDLLEPTSTNLETCHEKKSTMQFGMLGLGRMGANMARRLTKNGHPCVAYDRSPQTVKDLKTRS